MSKYLWLGRFAVAAFAASILALTAGGCSKDDGSKGKTYALSVEVEPGDDAGSVARDPKGPYKNGDTVTLTATANEGYRFLAWELDSGRTSAANPIEIAFAGNRDKDIKAVFGEEFRLIGRVSTNAAQNGGSIGDVSDTARRYLAGEDAQLTATADEGWEFSRWTATGYTLSTPERTRNPLTVTFEASNITLTAEFRRAAYTLNIDILDDTLSGSVEARPDKATYAWGDEVLLIAKAKGKHKFTGWEVNGDASPTLDTVLSLTIQGNVDVTASFAVYYTLRLLNDGNGTADFENAADRGRAFFPGDSVTVVALARDGFKFKNWNNNTRLSSAEYTYTFGESDGELTAYFEPWVYSVNLGVWPADTANISAGSVTAALVKRGQETPITVGTPLSYGDTVRIRAAEKGQWDFWQWQTYGYRNNAKSFELVVTNDVYITAAFNPWFTLRATGDEGGRVTYDGAAAAKPKYVNNNEVLLAPVPATGYEFVKWTYANGKDVKETDDGVEFDGDNLKYTVIAPVGRGVAWYDPADYNIELKAVFKKIEVTLSTKVLVGTTTNNDAGTITPASGKKFNYGDVVDLEAEEKDGFTFIEWVGAPNTSGSETSITIVSDTTISAKFEETPAGKSGLVLTVSPSAGGEVLIDETNPTTFYDAEETYSLKAEPNPDYIFSHWEVTNGSIADEDADETEITFGEEKTSTRIRANFLKVHKLTVGETLSPALNETVTLTNGTVKITKEEAKVKGKYVNNTKITLTATANAHYEFAGWTGGVSGGTVGGTSAEGTITLTGDRTVGATFRPKKYQFDFAEVTGGNIRAETPNPAGYDYDSDVYVLAVPDEGWSFVSGSWSSNVTDYFFDANYNRRGLVRITGPGVAVSAGFVNDGYRVTTINVGVGGTSSVSPIKDKYTEGETVKLTATETAAGYEFLGWFATETGGTAITPVTGEPNSINVTVGSSNLTRYARFGVINYTVNISSPTGGTISVNDVLITTYPNGTYSRNFNVTTGAPTLSAVATTAGWILRSWAVDGQVVSTASEYTISLSGSRTKTVTATFGSTEGTAQLIVGPFDAGQASHGTIDIVAGNNNYNLPDNGSWSGRFDHGVNYSLTAVPNNGWKFKSWYKTNTNTPFGSESPLTGTITNAGDEHLFYEFEAATYTITRNAVVGASVPGYPLTLAGHSEYTYGEEVRVNSDRTNSGWVSTTRVTDVYNLTGFEWASTLSPAANVNGVNTGANNFVNTLSAGGTTYGNYTVTLTVTPRYYSVGVGRTSESPSGIGNVTVSGVPALIEGKATYGTALTYTAEAVNGYDFKGWFNSPSGVGTALSIENTYPTTVNADVTLYAMYQAKTYAVNLGEASNGTISVNPNNGTYTHGSNVTITASPKENYKVATFSVNGSPVDLTKVVDGESVDTTLSVVGYVDVVATFTDRPSFVLVVSTVSNGTLKAYYSDDVNRANEIVSGTAVQSGKTIILEAKGTANSAFKVKTLTAPSLDAEEKAPDHTQTEFTFTMPAQNTSVSATFEKAFRVTSAVSADWTVDMNDVATVSIVPEPVNDYIWKGRVTYSYEKWSGSNKDWNDFKGWFGSGASSFGNSKDFIVDVVSDTMLTAKFEELAYNVVDLSSTIKTYGGDNGGTFVLSTDGKSTVKRDGNWFRHGSTVSLTPTPATNFAGYGFFLDTDSTFWGRYSSEGTPVTVFSKQNITNTVDFSSDFDSVAFASVNLGKLAAVGVDGVVVSGVTYTYKTLGGSGGSDVALPVPFGWSTRTDVSFGDTILVNTSDLPNNIGFKWVWAVTTSLIANVPENFDQSTITIPVGSGDDDRNIRIWFKQEIDY